MHYIALLRGINVSGKNKLPMADLRALCERLGWQNVQSYIQSGNLRFELERSEGAASALSVAIKQEFGYEVPVLVRPQAYFQERLQNPFLEEDRALELKALHATFLATSPTATQITALKAKDHKGDQWTVVNDCVYLYCPNGYGRTKLTNKYLEKNLGAVATTRNWRTLNKLARWE
ncbi:MAG: DUF1697 domain-containing protein [Aureispira sp.]